MISGYAMTDCRLRHARSPIRRNSSPTSAKTIENSPVAGVKQLLA